MKNSLYTIAALKKDLLFYGTVKLFCKISVAIFLKNDYSWKYLTSQVHNPHCADNDSICDFCDGEDFKNHQLFGENSLALILHCYFDEFQVTNPLGSKTKRHKLGTVYITHTHLYNIYIYNTVKYAHLIWDKFVNRQNGHTCMYIYIWYRYIISWLACACSQNCPLHLV